MRSLFFIFKFNNMKTANLVISCPDRPGIVKSVTDFLFRHQTNVSYLEQHIEDAQFFMRIEWQILRSDLVDSKVFHQKFQNIQEEFRMDIKVDFNERRKRVGLFCSKELHCLIDILGRVEINEMEIDIPFIISNFKNAEVVAGKFEIPFYHVPCKDGYEEKQLEIVRENNIDVLGLARYMKILSEQFLAEIGQDHIINVHHSFLPSFVGAHPYKEAYQRGVKLIGATAHYVIPELD